MKTNTSIAIARILSTSILFLLFVSRWWEIGSLIAPLRCLLPGVKVAMITTTATTTTSTRKTGALICSLSIDAVIGVNGSSLLIWACIPKGRRSGNRFLEQGHREWLPMAAIFALRRSLRECRSGVELKFLSRGQSIL